MQINSTGSGCAFFWRFWRFFKQVSPLKRTLPSSHGVYSAGSILLWSVEIQQLLCLILQERMGLSKIALSKFKKEVQAVIIYVNAHYVDKLTLDSIADYVGLNREYLSRLFSKETGTGLFQYINEVRMKRAGEMIRSNKQVYIKEVAAAVGFDDPYFFSRKFKDFYGKTPSEYAEA